jgi:hypothetical protein
MSEQEESVPISKPATKQAQQSHPVFYVYIAILEEPMTLENFAHIMPGGWFLYLKMESKATFTSIMKKLRREHTLCKSQSYELRLSMEPYARICDNDTPDSVSDCLSLLGNSLLITASLQIETRYGSARMHLKWTRVLKEEGLPIRLWPKQKKLG